MRVLVTEGAGYIGSCVVEELSLAAMKCEFLIAFFGVESRSRK
jgi:UDP-glucose 4-epimerase